MGKPIVTILCIVSILNVSLASVSRAADAATWEMWPKTTNEPDIERGPAAETIELANDWETWPRKKPEPDVAPKPALEVKPSVEAADDSSRKKASKRSYGKIVWIVLGIAAAVGIGIAAGSGGGGGGDNGGTVVNPGHK